MTAEELRRANAGLAPDGSLLPGFKSVGVRADGSFVDPKMYQDTFTAGYGSKPFTGVVGAAGWSESGKAFVSPPVNVQPPAATAPLSGATIPNANTATARVFAPPPTFDDPAVQYSPLSGGNGPMLVWAAVAVVAYLALKK